MATADNKYGFHRESALPEVTWDTNPPKINFTEADFFDNYSCCYCHEEFDNKTTFEAHKKDRQSRNYYCRHCQVEFSDQTELTDHINETHVRSPTTWEVPDLSEDSDNLRNKTCLRCVADGHGSASCTEAVTCKQCRNSPHFSRRCDECRPKSGC